MLLSLLSKEEKYRFLDLLGKLVSVDGEPSESDKQIIESLSREMGRDVLRYRPGNDSVEELIEYFVKKNKMTRNLIFLNLVSASLIDDWYSVEEHFLIEEIQNAFEISAKKKSELMKIVYSERDLREKAKRVLAE